MCGKLRVVGRNRIEEGSDVGRGTGQLLNLNASFIIRPLCKPVEWASVFPRLCTFLIYLRETLIVFSL